MRLTRATQPIGIAAMDAKRAIRGERKTNSVTVTSTADTPERGLPRGGNDVGYPRRIRASDLSVRAMVENV